MPRLIAGVLIIIASVLLGGAVSGVYKRRIKFLNDYLEFISFSEGEIQVFRREIKLLIERFTKERDGDFSQFLRRRFLDNENCASDDDKLSVEEFVMGLSELDSESQKGYIELCKERAEKSLREAEQNEKIKGATIKKLLPLGGAALFLIII